eukprot:sb/3471662/
MSDEDYIPPPQKMELKLGHTAAASHQMNVTPGQLQAVVQGLFKDITGMETICSKTKLRKERDMSGEEALERVKRGPAPVALYFDGKRVWKSLKEGNAFQEQITVLGYTSADDPDPLTRYYGYSLSSDKFTGVEKPCELVARGIVAHLEELGISTSNIRAIGCDGCSPNVGRIGGRCKKRS